MLIDSYLVHTCYKMSDGIDGWSKPKMLDEPIKMPCRWRQKTKLVRDKTGKEIVSQIQVALRPDASVKIGDLLSRDMVKSYEIISIGEKQDIPGSIQALRVYL